MSTPAPSADDPAELTLPPALWSGIRHAALAGRLVLLPAALFTLLAAWINRPVDGGLVGVVITLMALGLGALAGLSLLSARRSLDAGAALLALLLAGAEAVQAFGLLGSGVGELGGREFYVLPFLAWALLLGGGLPLFASLLPGPTATAPRDVPNPFAAAAAAAARRSTSGTSATSGTTAASGTSAASGATTPAPPVAPPQSGSGPQAPSGGGEPSAAPPSGPRPDSPFARPAETPATSVTTVAPAASREPTSSTPRAQDPEPGWYPSPDGVTARWWDGSSWSDDRRPLSDFDGD